MKKWMKVIIRARNDREWRTVEVKIAASGKALLIDNFDEKEENIDGNPRTME
jgi:hypothetical protein